MFLEITSPDTSTCACVRLNPYPVVVSRHSQKYTLQGQALASILSKGYNPEINYIHLQIRRDILIICLLVYISTRHLLMKLVAFITGGYFRNVVRPLLPSPT